MVVIAAVGEARLHAQMPRIRWDGIQGRDRARVDGGRTAAREREEEKEERRRGMEPRCWFCRDGPGWLDLSRRRGKRRRAGREEGRRGGRGGGERGEEAALLFSFYPLSV